MTNRVQLLATREVVENLRAKAFWIFTAIASLAVVAIVVLPAILSSDEDAFAVGLAGTSSEALTRSLVGLQGQIDLEIEITTPSAAEARALVADGDLDVAVVDGRRLLVKDPINPGSPSTRTQLVLLVERAARSIAALDDAGLDAEATLRALSAPPLPIEALEPDDELSSGQQAGAGLAVIVVLILIQTYSMSTLNSVNREKASRLVEVLLLTTRPRQILMAKVLGNLAVALVQLSVVIASYWIAATLVSSSPTVEEIGFRPFVAAAVWFLLGYLVYSSLGGALGALTDRARDTGSVTFPLFVPLFVGYSFAIGTIGSEPSAVVKVLSYVPLTSPTVMAARTAVDNASTTELAASIASTLAGAGLILWLGGRVFARAVGQTGRKIPLREALRDAVGRGTDGG